MTNPAWGSWNSEIPKGWVRFGTGENMFITVRLTGEPAIRSGGYGGWEEIKRPREDAFIEWMGHSAMKLTVPIMFDGRLPDLGGELEEEPWGDSVERDIKILESMTRKDPSANSPPILGIGSQLVPHGGKSWVIDDIVWASDDIRRPTDGDRTRASCVVHFLEFLSIDLLLQSRKHKPKGKPHTSHKSRGRYIVKQGDTTKKIAKKQLGSAARYSEINSINNIRDGNTLVIGSELMLP